MAEVGLLRLDLCNACVLYVVMASQCFAITPFHYISVQSIHYLVIDTLSFAVQCNCKVHQYLCFVGHRSLDQSICQQHGLNGRQQSMPHMFTLASISLGLALNTAVVERGFSLHLVIKDRLRNRL